MWVVEAGNDLDLAQEAVGPYGSRQFGVQDFDSNPAAVFEVFRQKDRCHAATADLTLDGIAVGKGLR